MVYWRRIIIIGVLMLSCTLAVYAQRDENCPAFVTAALEAVAHACDDVNRNQACYGNNQITAEFWQARSDLTFSLPSDRVALADLRRLATAALDLDSSLWGVAVLKVQANIPETLPGQAVIFLVMGDTSLENAVPLDKAALPVTPVMAQAAARANLRSLPTTSANVVGGAETGDQLALIGVNGSKDWFEVQREGGARAWIASSLVTVSDTGALADLPVTDDSAGPRYAPMQAFYFKSGLGRSRCDEAPNVLAVQSPKNITVTLNINGLEFSLGSTIIFTSAQLDDGTPVLVGALVEGTVTMRTLAFAAEMTQPGQTFAVTLNADGMVDENSRLVNLDNNADVETAIRYGCRSLMNNPLLPSPPTACDFPLDYDVVIPVGGTGDLSGIGPEDACTVAAIQLVNLRGGPGTNYAWNGQLLAGELATPDGYAVGDDGLSWWRLSNGLWVRSDLVNQAGACAALPLVHPPATPAPPGPAVSGFFELRHRCQDLNQVRPGQTITFQDGIGRWPTPAEKEAALAGQSATFTIDGVPLPVYYEGTTWHTGDGAPDGYGERARADWVATPGTHTVAGYWTLHGGTDTCVFTVAP